MTCKKDTKTGTAHWLDFIPKKNCMHQAIRILFMPTTTMLKAQT